MTSGLKGKLAKCLHISELRNLMTSGVPGSQDSTYLVDNADGSYTLINENGMEYDFGYHLVISEDTIFLTDLDGHAADTVLLSGITGMAKIDTFTINNDTLKISLLNDAEGVWKVLLSDYKQTLSWDPGTGNLGISFGNTVNLDGRYLKSDSITNEIETQGNTITSDVSGRIDTALAVTSHTIVLGGNTLYSQTNGIIDTADLSSLNVGDGNGPYSGNGGNGGDGTVPDDTYTNIPKLDHWWIGHFTNWPISVINQHDRGILFNQNEIGMYTGDSITVVRNKYEQDATGFLINADKGFQMTGAKIEHDSFNIYSKAVATNLGSRIDGTYDSLNLKGQVLEVKSPKLFLNDQGGTGLGTLGYIWKSDPVNGNYWGVDSLGAGVASNTLSLSGNTMTSNVDGAIDTSLVIGSNSLNGLGNTATSSINGISDTMIIINPVSYTHLTLPTSDLV